MSDLEGAILSEYLLLKCISKSGTADVYRARQQGGGGYEVAVKVFRPGYAQRKSFRDYFMTEAEKIGQLDHPNILPFLEFGEGEGLLYTVTPFVPTGTLEDLLGRVGGKFSAIQVLPIMQQLCSAVQYAHDCDIIHGNIKPVNVFVAADGRVLLSDFGITRGYDDSQQSLTRIGWGSAEYAAPEQSLGVLRRSSDIYALGVLLFRLLTGQTPFTGQTPVEVLLKHVRQQPPSACTLVPSISEAVDGVLLKAMQKRSDERFASAKEFSEALAAAVNFAPIAFPLATPVSIVQQQPAPGFLASTGPADDPLTPMPDHVELAQRVVPPAHFLQEDDDFGPSMFEWVGPVEWSPIGSGQSLPAPASASEYLRSMPMKPEEPPVPVGMQERNGVTFSVSPFAALGTENPSPGPNLPAIAQPRPVPPQPAPPPKADSKDSKTALSFIKKVLPLVVVILLLLGLLAALLSSFFYPAGGTHSDNARPLLLAALAVSKFSAYR